MASYPINFHFLGLILSGNEVSQILLSVMLAYYGGQRNRPRFIAWGVVFCSLSCFILALPHFIYGPGEEAIRLTKEYMESINNNSTIVSFLKHQRSVKWISLLFSWTTRQSKSFLGRRIACAWRSLKSKSATTRSNQSLLWSWSLFRSLF